MNYTFTPPGLPINYLGAFTGTHGDPPGLSKRLRGPHGVVATPAAESEGGAQGAPTWLI